MPTPEPASTPVAPPAVPRTTPATRNIRRTGTSEYRQTQTAKRPADNLSSARNPSKRLQRAPEPTPASLPRSPPTSTSAALRRSLPTTETRSPRPSKRVQAPVRRLCPFCDEVLGDTLSDTFEDLLAAARRKSRRAYRANNPLALKAPLVVTADVCERHRFESTLVPEAISRGWPLRIDFDALPQRVEAQRHALDALLANPATSRFFLDAARNSTRVGRRRAESAMGQFATFERIQPGYYGERGAMLLFQSLLSLYPPSTLQQFQERFAPLAPVTFIQSVLVPEVAIALIMQDLDLTRQAALDTMHASARYGSIMFADDDCGEEDTVGDLLVRECARLRRVSR